MGPDVAIFSHHLFKVSEPFITQQAEHLRRYHPVYLGRERFGSPPPEAQSLALQDLPEERRFVRRAWQVVSRAPNSYVRLLEGRRPALIHAHFGVDGVYALRLAKRLDVPLVTTFHGFDATTSLPALLLSGAAAWVNYALFRRQLAREGDLFLCVSEYIRQRVLRLGFPEERTHVHYIGIDTEAIQPRSPAEEQPFILHVARLVEKKGTEYLLKAFSRIAAQVPGVELVIIGEGPLKASLQALAESLGLRDRVRFLGAQPHTEVMDWMRRAALLAVPSVTAASGDTEGLPFVLLEAAALGLPVVGTVHSGIPEAIADGRSGCLVPERDDEALAARLLELMTDKSKRIAMGAEARALVESRFDIRVQTEKLEMLYDGVLR